MPIRKKVLYIWTFCTVLLVRVALWCVPYRHLAGWAASVSVRGGASSNNGLGIESDVVDAVNSASAVVPDATCLTRALSLQLLLGWHGLSSELKIGVDKEETGKLVAHAWLVVDQKIVIGKTPDIGRYAVLGR